MCIYIYIYILYFKLHRCSNHLNQSYFGIKSLTLDCSLVIIEEKWLMRNPCIFLGCFAFGMSCVGSGPFPFSASSGGRWTGSCPKIRAHLVRRTQPPVKGSYMSALNARLVYRATGASGGRRWRPHPPPTLPDKHNLHVTHGDP